MALIKKATKTVATITAGLTKLIDELNQHASDQTSAAGKFETDANTLTAKAADARTEAERATAVASKISALVG